MISFGSASALLPMRSLLLLLWHFVCSATSTVNSSNHNGHSCQPKFAASSLQISLGAAKTPVWLYKQSHAEANNLPDFHPVAYRTADGQAHLMITHFENYRISGATLDSLSSTQKTFDSEGSWHSIDWGNFGHHQWVGAPFTNDGKVFCSLRLVSSPCPRPHPRHCPHSTLLHPHSSTHPHPHPHPHPHLTQVAAELSTPEEVEEDSADEEEEDDDDPEVEGEAEAANGSAEDAARSDGDTDASSIKRVPTEDRQPSQADAVPLTAPTADLPAAAASA